MLPNGNIGFAIAGLNTLIYGLYCIWPQHNLFSFMNNFTFSMYGVNKGYVHNMLLCHFTHMSFFTYLIDTGIIFLLCQNLGMMMGNLFIAKTVLLSLFCGSALMYLHHSAYRLNKAYHGNDAIMRGLIFSIIWSNPQQSLMLFPIPISIPAWFIGGALVLMDILTMNSPAFGGLGASWLMLNYFP